MSERVFAAGMVTAGLLTATACGTESMPNAETMQVACVNVKGLAPYTEAACAEVATNVQAGLQQLSEQSGGRIKNLRVSHKLYPDVIQVENAIDKRCANFNVEPKNLMPYQIFIKGVADTALRQMGESDSTTPVFIAVNAPKDVCRAKAPEGAFLEHTKTEKCTESKAPHFGSAASFFSSGRPTVLTFPHSNNTAMQQLVVHERLHLGNGEKGLDHEFALCNKEGDSLPETINASNAATINLDGNSDRLSIMGTWAHGEHIAPPHLLHIGAIDGQRVHKPTQSGELTLHEPITSAEGTVLIQLPLQSEAIKAVIGKEFAKLSAVEALNALKPADYVTYIGKIPGKNKVGVYAAPAADKVNRKYAPTFLIKELAADQKIIIEDDFAITVKNISTQDATVQLELK